MRLFVLSIAIMVFSAAHSQKYEYGNFKNKAGNLKYRYLQPQKVDASTKYPLIIVLHGAGERGHDNEAQLVHGSNLFLQDKVRKEFPAFVIFPQCPAGDYWSNVQIQQRNGKRFFHFSDDDPPTKAMQMVLGLVDSLKEDERVDQSRIYLGGLSMGGMGTFELLYRRPDVFAAAFPICGGGHPDMVDNYNPQASYWIFHGKEDSVVPYEHSQEMFNAMKAKGLDVKFTLYPGVQHNSWDNAFNEPDLLPCLFSKQLN